MKKKLLLICLTFTTFISFSQTSNTTALDNDFSKKKLTSENITAFQFRAEQKIHDFYNYVQLISTKNYDEKLRLHSIKTAIELFNSTNCEISDRFLITDSNSVTIETYFNQLLTTKYAKIIGTVKDITLATNLTETNEGGYFGTMLFTRVLTCYDKKGNIKDISEEQKSVEVTLERKIKKFGEIEKIIWIVNLCTITDFE